MRRGVCDAIPQFVQHIVGSIARSWLVPGEPRRCTRMGSAAAGAPVYSGAADVAFAARAPARDA
jgi:hypothetical protein